MVHMVPPMYFPADPPVHTLLDDTFESAAADALVNINNQLANAESLENQLQQLNETMNNTFQSLQSYTIAPEGILMPQIAPLSDPSVNTTTTIQVLQDLSDIDGSFYTEDDENATYIQTTTTIEFLEPIDINSTVEFTPPQVFPTQSSTNHYQLQSDFTQLLHFPSSINPEQIVDPPNQLIEPATQQQAADAQLQLPNQQMNSTLQLLDPSSQEMNTSVEWMELDDQPVDGAGPAYGTLVILQDEVAPPEEIFTLLPY
ncbi:hypothetical protein TNCT_363971 [Trichonephila clavata]|uniref:Uncharacterized protein n=1 Tax=Trichonephila clavata TaxID=2740835 RepID=A0A8X6HYT3_TRICU|nr:hypothetical protein TNCT_363971 [Trichonephila clavata]